MDPLSIPTMTRSDSTASTTSSADDDAVFEGVRSSAPRSLLVSGLPEDLSEISVANEATFRFGEKTRALAVEQPLTGGGDVPPPSALGGASMAGAGLTADMFGATATRRDQSPSPTAAPPLPSFYRVSKASSYESSAPLRKLMLDLETNFAASGVAWTMSNGSAVRYECDAFVCRSRCEFAVTIFALPGGRHVVDVAPQSGCRMAFKEMYKGLADGCVYCTPPKTASPSSSPARKFEPLPLPASLASPSISRDDVAVDEAARLEGMLSGGSSQHEAARAVCSLAAKHPEQAARMFGSSKALCDVIAHAAAADAEDEHARTGTTLLACATIADVAVASQKTGTAVDFLAGQIETLKLQAEDTECAHARRECLRAFSAMGKLEALRSKIVRAGVVELLEIEAEAGAEEGRTEDHLAREYARSALVACRS